MGVSMAVSGWVELRVQCDGRDELVYQFPKISEAVEMMAFVHEFFPKGRFVIQPLPQ